MRYRKDRNAYRDGGDDRPIAAMPCIVGPVPSNTRGRRVDEHLMLGCNTSACFDAPEWRDAISTHPSGAVPAIIAPLRSPG